MVGGVSRVCGDNIFVFAVHLVWLVHLGHLGPVYHESAIVWCVIMLLQFEDREGSGSSKANMRMEAYFRQLDVAVAGLR